MQKDDGEEQKKKREKKKRAPLPNEAGMLMRRQTTVFWLGSLYHPTCVLLFITSFQQWEKKKVSEKSLLINTPLKDI